MNEYQDKEKISLTQFVNYIKSSGCFIGDDGHIYRKNGKPLSRICSNGYFLARMMIKNKTYHFMEHRVVWSWSNEAEIPEGKEINHKDFDRSNNKIDNLEIMTHKENVEYSRDNMLESMPRGEKNGKAILRNNDVRLIRELSKHGYKQKDIAKLFNLKHRNLVSRVITGARYGSVENASDFMSVYPLFVDRLRNRSISERDELINYVIGLCGESGEVADIVKKHIFHDHELDQTELVYELGDCLFYICAICNVLGIDFFDLYIANMDKLNKRYPNGFSCYDSINREESRQKRGVIGGSGDNR